MIERNQRANTRGKGKSLATTKNKGARTERKPFHSSEGRHKSLLDLLNSKPPSLHTLHHLLQLPTTLTRPSKLVQRRSRRTTNYAHSQARTQRTLQHPLHSDRSRNRLLLHRHPSNNLVLLDSVRRERERLSDVEDPLGRRIVGSREGFGLRFGDGWGGDGDGEGDVGDGWFGG